MHDEYGVYFRPELAAGQLRRAKSLLIWRLGSTVLSAGLLAGAWFAWPDQFGEWAPWMIGVSVGSGLLLAAFSLAQWLRIRRDAAAAQPGLAIGLNRDGMLVGQRWIPWPEVGSVVARPGALGGSSTLVATARDHSTATVPLDYTDTMPASLDSAVRVLSSGRAWVDLSRLD